MNIEIIIYPRQAQGATKHLQKTNKKREKPEKPMTGPVVNSLATQQLKSMLKMGNSSTPSPPPQTSTPQAEKSRDVPANVSRLPTIPPDNNTKGFSLKRTTLPRVSQLFNKKSL